MFNLLMSFLLGSTIAAANPYAKYSLEQSVKNFAKAHCGLVGPIRINEGQNPYIYTTDFTLGNGYECRMHQRRWIQCTHPQTGDFFGYNIPPGGYISPAYHGTHGKVCS